MTRIRDSVYIAWLAWCTTAYGSDHLAPSLAAHIASPSAALIAAVVGLVLAFESWSRQQNDAERGRWLPLRLWTLRDWSGVAGGVGYLVLLSLALVEGKASSVFGMYIAIALTVGFVRTRIRVAPDASVPPQ